MQPYLLANRVNSARSCLEARFLFSCFPLREPPIIRLDQQEIHQFLCFYPGRSTSHETVERIYGFLYDPSETH